MTAPTVLDALPALADGQARHAAVLDALFSHLVVLDAQGGILEVNKSWRDFGRANGLKSPASTVGQNYLDVCDQARGAGSAQAAPTAAGIRAVLHGDVKSFSIEYPCHSRTEQRWFLLNVTPATGGSLKGAVLTHSLITQRVQTSDALAALTHQTSQRERMFNTMLASIPDFVYVVDRDGHFLFANQSLLDMWGMTLEHAIGKTFEELGYAPEVAAHMRSQVRQVFETRESVADERRFANPRTRQGTFEYILSPALAADGTVDLVVGSTRDVTQRRLSDAALRESEGRFRNLAEAMPQIVWMSLDDSRNIYVNQQWMLYTGMTLEESLGFGWNAAFHPDDRALAWQAWQEAMAAKATYSVESRIRSAEGVYRWWLVRGVPVPDASGGILKWIGTCTDIDELKLAQLAISRANTELQRQQAESRVLFDLMPAMIWFKDTENNILRVNERVAKIAGLAVSDIEGKPSAEIYPQEAAKYHADDLKVIRSGMPLLGMVEPVSDGDGNQLWVQTDKVPYRDESGKVIGIVVMAQDITQRKHDQDALRELNTDLEARVRRRTGQLELARTEAEQASEAKSTFLATMSHEIRTPMNGLLGLLELLSLGSLDPSQQAALKVARKSGADLQHIIDDILDFSKMEAGSVRLNPVAACVDDVVRSVCRLHSQAAAGKGLELSVHVAPQVSPLLMFDPLRLGQILNNFTNNAIKFTESGKVDVVVELAGSGAGTQELRFLVRDTGIGISPAQLGRLFQPFAQGTDQTTSHYGGTGLGLVISRSLAELMGGSVEVQSEPGKGTVMKLCVTFAVCDAATQAPAAAGTGAQSPQPPAAGRPAPSIQEAEADGTLLLVVDDHPVNLMVLRQQLASLGYAAEGVADGVEALAAWKSGRFGAVITDCNMPRINGYELAAAIRKLELRKGGRRTPIIACTANALPAATALCISAGMDDCLVKPVTLADISRMLDQWLPIGLLNLALLAQVSGGDAAAAAAVVADFRAANQHDSAQLRQAAASADFSGVANFSHRIKGACLMMGATALAAACGRVEDAGTAADAHAVQSALEGFEAQLLRLDSHLARQPAPHGLF